MVPATTHTYTHSLHDALPIFPDRPNRQEAIAENDSEKARRSASRDVWTPRSRIRDQAVPADMRSHDPDLQRPRRRDRKSTRLNSSHLGISYAVFCLKKKITKK